MENSERTNYEHVSSNGDVYLGNCKGILPQGNGKYTWSDGTVYEGQWEGGKINGNGMVIWPSGAIYEGDFLKGYLHDFGTYSTPDGSVYTGSWRFNIQQGIGKKQYHNSDVYEGSWKEGVREGIGRYVWSNGNMYVGVWKSGKMCGRGVMKWSSGEVFDGFWFNGCRNGSGFYKSADGSYYFGTWTTGLKDGWGTFYPKGSKMPSMKKWCSFALHKDKKEGSDFRSQMNLEEQRASKRGIITKHSFSQRISSSRIFRRSGHILSRKSILMEQDSNLMDSARKIASCDMACVLAFNSVRGQNEMENKVVVVYEREYIQGILMKERLMENVGLHIKLSERRCKAKEANKNSRVPICQGHTSYYLMLNLQLGIRYSVGKSTRAPMCEALSSDFDKQARVQVHFPKRGSQFTPPHKSLDFVWMDYCPMVFRNLREMFKLDTAEYMMSICGDDGLRELSSPGKSGSFFYRSHDDRFVIKTLKRSELKVLLNMLPSYYDHVKEHENTLVTKFFGVHQIAWQAGKKVRFVVTGNIFCTELRIHRSYDLKGSYQGRITSKDKMSKNTTLKDRDLSYEFQMDRLLHESLFKQLSIDCMFLESQQILDYSLLLGLHFRAPEHLKALLAPADSSHDESISATNVSSNSQHEVLIPPKGLILVTHEPNIVSTRPGPHIRGNALRALMLGHKEADLLLPGTGRLRIQLGVNMPAQANHKPLQDNVDSAEVELFEACDMVLYLGIIDILQEYNLKKKLENAYKSLRFDPMSISAIKPKLYSRRFIHFLQSKFHVEL